MRKRAGWISGVLGLGLLLAACGGDESSSPVTESDLVGRWFTRMVVTKGTITTKFPALGIDTTQKIDTTETYTGTTYYFDFKADHTYESNQPDSPDAKAVAAKVAFSGKELEKGKWWVNGNTLKNLPDGKTDTVSSTVHVDGGTLKLHFEIDSSGSEAGATFSIKLKADITASKN
jgi:hypothetical protein